MTRHEDYVRRRDRRAAEHICYSCGAAMDEGDTRWCCPECREKYSAYQRKYREARKAAGLCVVCGKPARADRCTCEECGRKAITRTREWRREK